MPTQTEDGDLVPFEYEVGAEEQDDVVEQLTRCGAIDLKARTLRSPAETVQIVLSGILGLRLLVRFLEFRRTSRMCRQIIDLRHDTIRALTDCGQRDGRLIIISPKGEIEISAPSDTPAVDALVEALRAGRDLPKEALAEANATLTRVRHEE